MCSIKKILYEKYCSVFVELMRRGYKVGDTLFYYHTQNNREIDFVLRESHVVSCLVQVSYDISNAKTRERELKAMEEAAKELKCGNLLLITWDTEDAVEYKGYIVKITSVKKWFLM